MSTASLLLLLVAGLTAGTVNAVAGGGSLITFPALLATGLGSLAANVTNSVAVSPGYLASVYGSRADLVGTTGQAENEPGGGLHGRHRLPGLLATAAAGSLIGCELLLHTSAAAFQWVVPFLVLAATAILALQPWLSRMGRDAADRDPQTLDQPQDGRRNILARHAAVGACAIYGGYFGAALGIVLMAALSVGSDAPLRYINACKNAVTAVVGVVTVVVFAVSASVDWADVAVVAPAALAGGYLGARLARRLPASVLRAAIVMFGTVVGAYLLVRAIAR